MMHKEGPKSFFKGWVPSLALSSHRMIMMYCYENINLVFGFKSGQKMSKENFIIPFLTGGVSKSIAATLLMPVVVVRLRL